MIVLLRHLLSILLLPFMVAAVVPYWLLTTRAAIDTRWHAASLIAWLPRLAGVALLAAGLAMFIWCVSLFARVGQGTLAPWDPTRKLVAVGPYRYVRNPMITGVTTVLIGEALVAGSWLIGAWAAVFVLVNHTYFVLSEERGLARRFGESYLAYKANVPRWIPRLTPWAGV